MAQPTSVHGAANDEHQAPQAKPDRPSCLEDKGAIATYRRWAYRAAWSLLQNPSPT